MRMKKNYVPILSITSSDTTGRTGLQADVRTITDMHGLALTATTCIAMPDARGETAIYNLPDHVVEAQVSGIISSEHPRAIKVGLVRTANAVRRVRNEIVGCGRIVCAPGILSATGSRLVDDETLSAISRWLIPEATLLMLRCSEAALLLGREILTDDDMTAAASELCRQGAEWVMLRGGHVTAGRLTALLYSPSSARFFSSLNTDGWQRHGVGGALSSAIATRLGMGDDVEDAVRRGHNYVHSQVVYAVSGGARGSRAADIYAQLMSLIAAHYREAHHVNFYAERLSITPHYLSVATREAVGKGASHIINEYLAAESLSLMRSTRLTVQQVALRLGFASQSDFCKFFHRMHGVPPSKARFL